MYYLCTVIKKQINIKNKKIMEIINVLGIDFVRINNDLYGNPRYLVSFDTFSSNKEEALKIAKKIGGHKYRSKKRKAIVFQCYNLPTLAKDILEIKNK